MKVCKGPLNGPESKMSLKWSSFAIESKDTIGMSSLDKPVAVFLDSLVGLNKITISSSLTELHTRHNPNV